MAGVNLAVSLYEYIVSLKDGVVCVVNDVLGLVNLCGMSDLKLISISRPTLLWISSRQNVHVVYER